MAQNKTLEVKRHEIQEDRILYWGDEKDYHIIADEDCEARVGDVIEYEPDGVNFGWFVGVVKYAQPD